MRFKGPSGYTGELAQCELFGEINSGKLKELIGSRDRFNKIELIYGKERRREILMREGGYFSYNDSIKLVKSIQPPGDPTDPDPDFARDLHATIADGLGMEDYSDLKFYTAVHSPLDNSHGVDAFFEIDIKGKIFIVTLDVTRNPNKDEHKADAVFSWPTNGLDRKIKEDREAWNEKLAEVSGKVIESLEKKIEELHKKFN